MRFFLLDMYILGAKLQSQNKIKKISIKKNKHDIFYYLLRLSILNVPCACHLGYEFVGKQIFSLILQVPDTLESIKISCSGT